MRHKNAEPRTRLEHHLVRPIIGVVPCSLFTGLFVSPRIASTGHRHVAGFQYSAAAVGSRCGRYLVIERPRYILFGCDRPNEIRVCPTVLIDMLRLMLNHLLDIVVDGRSTCKRSRRYTRVKIGPRHFI